MSLLIPPAGVLFYQLLLSDRSRNLLGELKQERQQKQGFKIVHSSLRVVVHDDIDTRLIVLIVPINTNRQ